MRRALLPPSPFPSPPHNAMAEDGWGGEATVTAAVASSARSAHSSSSSSAAARRHAAACSNMAALVRASGKFEVLHRLLPKLRAAGHRVLLFSQFTTVLDLVADMAEGALGMEALRLDGRVAGGEREDALRAFNDPHASHHLFLLSTRAGGLGINLQSADTVIIFDSDWNPQQDLQAQVRSDQLFLNALWIGCFG